MNKRLILYVEGLTEQIFVDRMLRHHLTGHGVKVERPILAARTPDPDGPRGGFTNWPAMEADLRDLFMGDADANLRFTTLLDLYAMPPGVPGRPGVFGASSSAGETDAIESEIAAVLCEPRFVPYLQQHEFEALLLSHPPALATIFPGHVAEINSLAADVAGFTTPEDIDHGRNTHPGARIAKAIPEYYDLKASNGFWAAAEIGLDAMRAACPRFHKWLGRWEAWGAV